MELVKVPNPILTTVCEEVTSTSDVIFDAKEMVTVAEENDLAGLSANQVGINARFFIAQVVEEGDFILFINPKVKGDKKKGRGFGWEGCGSIDTVQCLVERWNDVRIDYTDKQGENVFMLLKGKMARRVQHENDHLNGILITDKARERKAK